MSRHAAQVVVVGSGAGGATAARELARAGIDVLLLEQGERLRPEDMSQREEEMIPRLFVDGGGRTTVDGAVTVLQGHGLGGSTLHNLNLCKRVPDRLLARWSEERGLPELPSRLAEHYAAIEAELGVVEVVPGQVNRHNALFQRGCAALGLEHALLHHNRRGCVGSGFCELGCAWDAKNNAAKVMLPAAEAAGARVLTGHRVRRIRQLGRRVTGVEGVGPQGEPFRVDAATVVLSASATTTPALILASGLGDRYGRVGAHLHLHPAATIGALFDDPVEAWKGIPQTVECTSLLHPTDPERRIWIVPVFAHPAGAAGLLPGIGPELTGLMRQYRYLAAASPMLHDHGHGRITATRDGRPRIHYQLDPGDARALAGGIRTTAQIWLAAGARKVLIPWADPVQLSSLAECEGLADRLPRPFDPPLAAVHPMGGMGMAADPRLGPCDGEGRVHHLSGLWVADGSLFPSSTGVPPQLTIYALGRMVGQAVAASLG